MYTSSFGLSPLSRVVHVRLYDVKWSNISHSAVPWTTKHGHETILFRIKWSVYSFSLFSKLHLPKTQDLSMINKEYRRDELANDTPVYAHFTLYGLSSHSIPAW